MIFTDEINQSELDGTAPFLIYQILGGFCSNLFPMLAILITLLYALDQRRENHLDGSILVSEDKSQSYRSLIEEVKERSLSDQRDAVVRALNTHMETCSEE